MPKLCRINIEEGEKVLEGLKELVKELKDRFDCEIYLFGSFAKGEVHEGSDIDLIIVGDFKERFFERIGIILDMTDLLTELVYTREEFEAMKKENPFIRDVLKDARRL